MTRLPQVLVNVRVAAPRSRHRDDRSPTTSPPPKPELGAVGRVLVRPSGTEPLIRVMVEAPTQDDADAAATRLVGAVERACGAAVLTEARP